LLFRYSNPINRIRLIVARLVRVYRVGRDISLLLIGVIL